MNTPKKQQHTRTLKAIVGSAIILISAVLLGTMAWMVFVKEPLVGTDDQAKDRIVASDSDPLTASAITAIHTLHKQLNDLTGYGNLEGFNFVENNTRLAQIQKNLTELTADVANPEVKMDLQNARNLAKQAEEQQDEEALRYTHRILHDLDIDLNHYTGTSDYFHVTNNADGTNVKEVLNILKR